MATAIQPLEPSSTHKTCTNLLNDSLCMVYIDSSSNRNKIHTYATDKEYFYIAYSTDDMLLKYSSIDNRDNIISLSEMYHDIFWRKRNMISFGDNSYKGNDTQIKYSYILIANFMQTFLALHLGLSLVMVMILNKVPPLLCFHIIIKVLFEQLIS